MSQDKTIHQVLCMAKSNTASVTASDSESFSSCYATGTDDSFLSLDDFSSSETICNSRNEKQGGIFSSNYDLKNDLPKDLPSLYDIVNSHRGSVRSPQNVTMYASYIVSTLKAYGGGIPRDSRVINKESHLMFRTLDILYDLLTEFKATSWHTHKFVDTTLCRNCEWRENCLKSFTPQNPEYTNRFCTVCLIFVPQKRYSEHVKSDTHLKKRNCLIDCAYPFVKCEMRYSSLQDAQNHICSHVCEGGYPKFKPLMCFVCRVSFKSPSDLEEHSRSGEHSLCIEIAKELTFRRDAMSTEYRDAVWEEPTRKQNSSALGDRRMARHSTPTPDLSNRHNFTSQKCWGSEACVEQKCAYQQKEVYETEHYETSTAQHKEIEEQDKLPNSYFCSSCSVMVPAAGRRVHEKGKNHLRHSASREQIRTNAIAPSNNLDHSVAPITKQAVIVNSSISVGSPLLDSSKKEANEKKREEKQHEGIGEQINPPNNYFCTSCSVTVPTANRWEHENGKNHLQHTTSRGAVNNSSVVHTNNLQFSPAPATKPAVIINSRGIQTNVGSPLHVHGIEGNSESEVSDADNNIKVVKGERNAFVIGNLVSVSLKEEFDQVCADKNVEDFELECEVCGVAFPIFNEDIELSVDMHVQNDPVHSLALAVPVHRNVQSVAKAAGETISVKLQKFSRNDVSIVQGKNNVVSEVLLLEQKCLSSPNKFSCKLCNVTYKSENDIFYHVLSHRHLSDKWFEQLTNKELQEKSRKLYSLLKHKYAVNNIYSAINWIKKKKAQRSDRDSESSSGAYEVSSSNTMVAPVTFEVTSASTSMQRKCANCSKNLDRMSRGARRNHKLKCTRKSNSSPSEGNLCMICLKDLGGMAEMGRQQHRQACSAKKSAFQVAQSPQSYVGSSISTVAASTSFVGGGSSSSNSSSSDGNLCKICLKDLGGMAKVGRQQHRQACSAKKSAFQVAQSPQSYVGSSISTVAASTSFVGGGSSSSNSSSSDGNLCKICLKDLGGMAKVGRQQHRQACSAKKSAFQVAQSPQSYVGSSISTVAASTSFVGGGSSSSNSSSSDGNLCKICLKDLGGMAKVGRQQHRQACSAKKSAFQVAQSPQSYVGSSISTVAASTSFVGTPASNVETCTGVMCPVCLEDISRLTKLGRKKHRKACSEHK